METTSSLVQAEIRRPAAFRLPERFQSFMMLLPSFGAILIFVYAFIGYTFYVSLSNWRTLKRDLTLRDPLFQTYEDLFKMPRWQYDLRNTVVFTVMFIAAAIIIGLTLAVLLDYHREKMASSFFRNVYLFPYALSFVVTGVAWRWIFNPETGVNLFFNIFGINDVLDKPLKPGWTTDPKIWLVVNDSLEKVWPASGDFLRAQLGIPVALIPVAIAATWQLSGFVMAMYTGGMSTIPTEIREAARIDGCNDFQVYWYIIVPLTRPITVSTVIILLHVSLKIFDLVFTMAGVGPGFATDMPAIFVFEQMFKATKYNLASAASIVMLILAALVIIPYLVHSLRKEE